MTLILANRNRPLVLRNIAALVSVAIPLTIAGCGKGETKVAAQGPSSVPVTIAVAVKKDMPVSVRSIGNVQAYQAVSIKSQINSQITEVICSLISTAANSKPTCAAPKTRCCATTLKPRTTASKPSALRNY